VWLPSLLLHLPQERLCQCMTQPVDTWQSRPSTMTCRSAKGQAWRRLVFSRQSRISSSLCCYYASCHKVGVVNFDGNILVCDENTKCISYCRAKLYWLNWVITIRKGKHTDTWLIVYISRLTNQPVKYIHTTWQLTMQIHNHILSTTHSTTFKNMSTVWVKL